VRHVLTLIGIEMRDAPAKARQRRHDKAVTNAGAGVLAAIRPGQRSAKPAGFIVSTSLLLRRAAGTPD
jgi:hypothetical protein